MEGNERYSQQGCEVILIRRAKRERGKMLYTIKEGGKVGDRGGKYCRSMMGVVGEVEGKEGNVQIQSNIHVHSHTPPEHNSCTYTQHSHLYSQTPHPPHIVSCLTYTFLTTPTTYFFFHTDSIPHPRQSFHTCMHFPATFVPHLGPATDKPSQE